MISNHTTLIEQRHDSAAEIAFAVEQFLAAGGKPQIIAQGVSGEVGMSGTSSHHDRLRAERDKLAPAVRAEAKKGLTASEAAKSLNMHIKRVLLIARENGFQFEQPK
ncbi:hypothetical protein [Pseudomonas protegens]|uniref:hypothetical protein n=1 Tax=Pseudomonas protegens TaxID=380021 RepID=UPI001B344CFA|nr:hypothetical protein [Pseudomonas protegens]MBP5120986.1 hypothetical protein [Pseudomonas protegens]